MPTTTLMPLNPVDEASRVRELRALDILDSPQEEEFDTLVEIAAQLFGMPFAAISFVDSERQWFKARVGFNFRCTHRKMAFCGYGMQRRSVMVIGDTWKDQRLAGSLLVQANPGVRFYAGAPLITRSNHCVGMFCVMDSKPRKMSKADQRLLELLARQVMSLLESRRLIANLADQIKEVRVLQNGFVAAAERLYAPEFKC